MLFYYENMPENVVCSMIENEKLNLEYIMKSYSTKRETFLSYTQKITDGIQRIEFTEHSDLLLEILSNLKDLSKKMSFITASHKNFSDMLDNLSLCDNNFSSNVEEYNSNMKIFQQDFIAFLVESEEFINKVLQNFEFQFADSVVSKPVTEPCNTSSEETSQVQPQLHQQPQPQIQVQAKIETEAKDDTKIQIEPIVQLKSQINDEAKIEPKIKQEAQTSQQAKEVLEDNNCLIISEMKGKVFLPYKVSTLKKLLAKFPEDYTDINDIIESEYVLPLSQFKNPILSRFKEAYSLMKDTEDASFLEALDYALELSFNSNLNPAIIAACKSKTELDIYLDCLDSQELDKFKIFDIKYEINPIAKIM